MPKKLSQPDEESVGQLLRFCRHIAGSCEVTAACLCSDSTLRSSREEKIVELLLIILDFQPRLMNYIKVLDGRNVIVFAVDKWIFERDVDRGFLGESLAGKIIFPYTPLINAEYLGAQEVILKKRLILELLRNLVLDFPELSHDLHIKPEYFMFETLVTRAKLFPPMIYSLLDFTRRNVREGNVGLVMPGYFEALKKLEKEDTITFSEEYVKISKKFVDRVNNENFRFVNLFRTAQRTLFTYLLGIFPTALNLVSQDKGRFLGFARPRENTNRHSQLEDPYKFLFIPTASGLISLATKMDVEAFARKVFSISESSEINIEEIGGVLNDVYLVKIGVDREERKIVVKRFRDWSGFKWFPLTLWSFGTKTFAVLGRSRLDRECSINQLLYSKGFAVPKILNVNHAERLIFMEFVEGANLRELIKRVINRKNIEESKEDLYIIGGVGEKFAELHALNIALGDTKPENIVVKRNGQICLLDFEQASRKGDKAWDIAEFLYYTGHYSSPFVGTLPTELITRAFIEGYTRARGDVSLIRKAGNPKYTKVFSVFTLPHIIWVISNICRNAGKPKG